MPGIKAKPSHYDQRLTTTDLTDYATFPADIARPKEFT